jgi:uncharacterized protein (TIGR03435 family)
MIGVVRAQEEPQFEVASVKPAAPRYGSDQGGVSGGPGTSDPVRFTGTNRSIVALVMHAYNVKRHQVVAPGWMETTRFDVHAKVPPGATRDSFRRMLQHLLADRFKLEIHRETKESAVFDLVQVKGGHKLPEYVEDSAAVKVRRAGTGLGRVPRPGMVIVWSPTGKSAITVESLGMPMAQIVGTLSNYVGKPVTDATGLTGKYNLKLSFDRQGLAGADGDHDATAGHASEPSGAPSLFKALQEQLGLKLEQRKGTIELIVLDKAEKTPTAN